MSSETTRGRLAGKTGVEARMFSSAEFRLDDDGSNIVRVSGYGSTFEPYKVHDGGPGGYFVEQILPGAFRGVVKSSDCVLQANHSGIALARVPSTMTLAEDAKGLRWEASLDCRSAAATDLLVALERKDVRACSFGFRLKAGDDEWNADQSRRTIRNVSEVFDISPPVSRIPGR